MQLKDKKVVLTGGLGGIGQALAKKLREAGAEVLIIDRAPGDNVLQADLGDDKALDDVCARLAHEPVDILINLAGLMYFGHLQDQDPGHIGAMMRINLEVPVRLAQAVLPGMKARGSGQIVNIGSMTGLVPLPYYGCYVATKAGLKGFSDSLRRELWGQNIAVTHISPRAVRTGMNGGAIAVFNERTHISLDEPDKIAERMFRAIVRKEKDVRIGLPENFYAVMSFLFPGIVDRGLETHRRIGREVLAQFNDRKEAPAQKSMAA